MNWIAIYVFLILGILVFLIILIRDMYCSKWKVCNIKAFILKKKLKYKDYCTVNFHNKLFWYKSAIEGIIIIEIVILLLHFGSFAFTHNIYGFSDMPIHETWVRELLAGNTYKEGVYPFGMHFILAIECCLNQNSILYAELFSGQIMNILSFIAVCYFLKNIFMNKETVIVFFALFIIAAFSMVNDTDSLKMIYDGLHRFRWTLPQEFALWAVFVSPACLIKILTLNKNSKDYKDELIKYTILFSLCILVTGATHYYAVLFQFIICISVVIVFSFQFTKNKLCFILVGTFTPIALVAVSLLLAVLSFGNLAYAVNWALGVPNGNQPIAESIASVGFLSNNSSWGLPQSRSSMQIFFDSVVNNIFLPLFNNQNWLIIILLFIFSVVSIVWAFINKRHEFINLKYLLVSIALVVIFVLYSSPAIGFLRILESYRLVICLYIFACCFLSFPFDVLVNIFKGHFKNKVLDSI